MDFFLIEITLKSPDPRPSGSRADRVAYREPYQCGVPA